MCTVRRVRRFEGFSMQKRVQGYHMSRNFGRCAPFFKFLVFSSTRRLSSVLLPPRECGQRWSMWCFLGSYSSRFFDVPLDDCPLGRFRNVSGPLLTLPTDEKYETDRGGDELN